MVDLQPLPVCCIFS